jgi:hypothetical protein
MASFPVVGFEVVFLFSPVLRFRCAGMQLANERHAIVKEPDHKDFSPHNKLSFFSFITIHTLHTTHHRHRNR